MEGESFTARMGGARAAMVKLGAATTVVGVAFLAYGVKAAGDFQQKMNLLVTACGESTSNLKQVSNGVLSLARQTGTSTDVLAEGMYQVEKAGYRAGDGLKVLRAAAQGAREEGANLKDVTNAMTSVMASYHLKASDSVRVMNALKTAAGEGKMTMQEFAGSLSTVIPIASANKISFGEVGGAIATLSQHGTSAREATQELASTIRQLAAPSNVAVQEMQRLGLSSVDVSTHLGKRGLTGTLDLLSQTVLSKMGKSGTLLLSSFNKTKQAAHDADVMVQSMPPNLQKLAASYAKGGLSLADWRKELKALPPAQANLLTQYATLQNKTNGFSAELKRGGPSAQTYTEAIKKLTGGAIGLNTTLQLTGENTAGFKDRVEKVSASFNHASKDVEGWKVTQASFNVQMSRLKEAIVTVAITIGLKLIPVILAVVTFFEKHKEVAAALATVIGVVLVSAMVAFTISVWNAAAALWATGIPEIVIGVSLLIVAIVLLATHWRQVWGFIKGIGLVVARAVVDAWHWVANGTVSIWHSITGAVATAWHAVGAFLSGAWHAVADPIVAAWHWVEKATVAVWNGITGFFRTWWPLLLVIFSLPIATIVAVWNHFHTAITNTVQAVWNGIAAFFGMIWAGILAVARVLWLGIKAGVVNPMISAWHLLVSIWNRVRGALSAAWGGIRSAAASVWSAIRTAMINPMISAWHSITSTVSSIQKAISGGLDKAWGAVKGIGGKFASIGKAIVMGIVHGVSSSAGSLYGSLKDLAGNALSSAKSFLGVNSPSKVFADHVGTAIPEGIAKGVTDNARLAHAAVRGVATGMIDEAAKTLGIASPSKVFRSLGIYVNQGLVDGLTASTARVKAATRRIETLLIQTRNRVADMMTPGKTKKDRSLNAWVRSHEKTIDRLEKYVKHEDGVLKGLAAKRDSVASKLKAAQSKLAAVQKQWTDEKNSVASGIMQNTSVVTTAPQDGFGLTSQDVVNNMRDQMAKVQQFASQLQALKKKGLSSDLIAQIAAAGVDQGGATATALAGANKSTIDQLNQMQGQMKTAANAAGTAVADSMYGAGIKSAQGLVKGLQSQEKAIEKQMLKIAKAMQKAIEKALGIHSPSRVFASLGQWIPAGLAQGISDGAHHATTAVSNLAGAVAGAGAMGSSGMAHAGVGGGGAVVHQHFEFHIEGSVATVDNLARDVEAAFLRRGMRNPVTYQSYKR